MGHLAGRYRRHGLGSRGVTEHHEPRNHPGRRTRSFVVVGSSRICSRRRGRHFEALHEPNRPSVGGCSRDATPVLAPCLPATCLSACEAQRDRHGNNVISQDRLIMQTSRTVSVLATLTKYACDTFRQCGEKGGVKAPIGCHVRTEGLTVQRALARQAPAAARRRCDKCSATLRCSRIATSGWLRAISSSACCVKA